MSTAYRTITRHQDRTGERTAREVFFAMLAASATCLLVGVAAVGYVVG